MRDGLSALSVCRLVRWYVFVWYFRTFDKAADSSGFSTRLQTPQGFRQPPLPPNLTWEQKIVQRISEVCAAQSNAPCVFMYAKVPMQSLEMTAGVLHVICRNYSGVTWESDSIFVSASWISARPHVGWIALHEKKNSTSYAQGRVIDSWRDPQRPGRRVFRAAWTPTAAIWPHPRGSGGLQYGQPEISFPNTNVVHPLQNFEGPPNIVVHIAPVDSLYVMITQGNEFRVKIGRSQNPHARAQQLSAGHPELIVVFHVWACKGPLERFVQERLAPLRVQNGGPGQEWFNVSPTMAVTLINLLISAVDTVESLVMQSM